MKFQKVTIGVFWVKAPESTEWPALEEWSLPVPSNQHAIKKKKSVGHLFFSRLQLIAVGSGWVVWETRVLPGMSQHCLGNCLLCGSLAYQRYVPRRHHSLCLKATAVGSWDDLIWIWLQGLSGRNWRQLAFCRGNVLKQAKSGNSRPFLLVSLAKLSCTRKSLFRSELLPYLWVS